MWVLLTIWVSLASVAVGYGGCDASVYDCDDNVDLIQTRFEGKSKEGFASSVTAHETQTTRSRTLRRRIGTLAPNVPSGQDRPADSRAQSLSLIRSMSGHKVCEGHGHSHKHCEQLGCCVYENGHCLSNVGKNLCRSESVLVERSVVVARDESHDQVRTGEAACEGHGLSESACGAVGCCKWDKGLCFSAVGADLCEATKISRSNSDRNHTVLLSTSSDESALVTVSGSHATTVTFDEYSGTNACSFKSEHGGPANCKIELPEHMLTETYLKPGMVVLELGARYGTTTCAIASQVGRKGKVVAVEPDPKVWDALIDNLQSHSCGASVLKGVVGEKDRKVGLISKNGAQTSLLQVEAVQAHATPLVAVERALGKQFDTLLIDCEGCVEVFLDENPGALDNIRTIIMEGDRGKYAGAVDESCGDNCVDYHKVIKRFEDAGFTMVETFQEGHGVRESMGDCCPWIHHFALQRF